MPLVFMDKKERTSHFPHFRKISLTHDNLCASTHHSLSVLSSLYNDIGEVFHVDSCIEEGEKKMTWRRIALDVAPSDTRYTQPLR